jgi:predicted house-cleaning NTP pyrophosphatase (Maf/HAM1 superfamily)
MILASKSPRRYELLKQMGLDFDVIPLRGNDQLVTRDEPDFHHTEVTMITPWKEA